MHSGILLALDQATVTGWCVGDIGQPFVLTPVEIAAGGARASLVSGFIRCDDVAAFRRWLRDTVEAHRPRGIVFESPVLVRTGKKRTSFHTAVKLMGIKEAIEYEAKRGGLWICENGRSSAYKAVVGNGGADKPDARDHLRALGFDVTSLDESDAIIHWHAAALLLREKGW
jgi:Holliday junction resolvasome RuvABC endonuclease subunit